MIKYKKFRLIFSGKFIESILVTCQNIPIPARVETVLLKTRCFKKIFFTFCSDGDELDALAGDVVEGLVDVGDFVETHLSPVRLGEGLAGYDFQ